MTQSQPVYRHEYQGWLASRGLRPGVWDYSECVDALYCTVIPLRIDPGPDYGHRTSMRVEWLDPPETADIQATLYSGDGKRAIRGFTDTTVRPNAVLVMQPPIPDIIKGDYKVAVICNNGGCPSTFTFAGEIVYEDLYEPPPETTNPWPTTGPRQTKTAAPGPVAATRSSAPSPEPVLTAGPDGRAKALGINPLAASQQASRPSSTAVDVTNLVVLALVAAIVFGGGAAVGLRIRRDLRPSQRGGRSGPR